VEQRVHVSVAQVRVSSDKRAPVIKGGHEDAPEALEGVTDDDALELAAAAITGLDHFLWRQRWVWR